MIRIQPNSHLDILTHYLSELKVVAKFESRIWCKRIGQLTYLEYAYIDVIASSQRTISIQCLGCSFMCVGKTKYPSNLRATHPACESKFSTKGVNFGHQTLNLPWTNFQKTWSIFASPPKNSRARVDSRVKLGPKGHHLR